jgi:hypothetical protein
MWLSPFEASQEVLPKQPQQPIVHPFENSGHDGSSHRLEETWSRFLMVFGYTVASLAQGCVLLFVGEAAGQGLWVDEG